MSILMYVVFVLLSQAVEAATSLWKSTMVVFLLGMEGTMLILMLVPFGMIMWRRSPGHQFSLKALLRKLVMRLKVFYCGPILTLSTNGLREVSDDEQTDRMMVFVDIGHHFFSIYLDHDESFQANPDEDDVVHNPRAHLPPVLSPAKRVDISAADTVEDQEE